MFFKIVIIVVLLVILYCLISAIYYLLFRKDAAHMVRALTWRIGLSILLFVALFIAYGLGWIHPHGIYNQ